jgi:hypothetical protein
MIKFEMFCIGHHIRERGSMQNRTFVIIQDIDICCLRWYMCSCYRFTSDLSSNSNYIMIKTMIVIAHKTNLTVKAIDCCFIKQFVQLNCN